MDLSLEAPGLGAARVELAWQRLIVLLCLACVLFARRPSSLLYPQFWAEDTSFFGTALSQGFWATLVIPLSGYLHTFPRLVAGLGLIVPLEAAPLAFSLAAFAVQMLPSLLILSPRMAAHLGTFSRRALAAALVVLLPNSAETYVNIPNSQWHLCLAALLVLFMDPPSRRAVAVLEGLLLALAALTGPFATLLLPVSLLLLRVRKAEGRHRQQAAILGAAVLIQGLFFLSAPRPELPISSGALGAAGFIRIFSTHVVLDTFLGIGGSVRLGPVAIGWHILGLVVAAVLAATIFRSGPRPLQALLFVSSASIALAFAFPLNSLDKWLQPSFAPRYFQLASLALAAAAVLLALHRDWSRILGVPLVAILVFAGVPLDFFHQERTDSHWLDQIAAYRSRPAGSRMFIPTNPRGYSLSLVRGNEPPVAFTLPQLPESSRPAAVISVPLRVTTAAGAGEPMVVLAGQAWDPEQSEPVASVFLFVDGRVYPAVTGHPPRGLPWNRPHQMARFKQFNREIPLAELGPGAHTLTMAITNSRGDTWLIAPPPISFAL